MSMNSYFTREAAEEGIELPLYRPGETTPSGDWIRIRGVDSDQFRLADTDSRRRLRESAGDKDLTKIFQEEMNLVLTSLVISWSFPEECNRENVSKFLREAPQIADMINRISGERKHFFKPGSKSSENTPEPNSN